MSLTRAEWEKMWRDATIIEETAQKFLKSPPTKQTILYKIREIKKQIESVIGQQR